MHKTKLSKTSKKAAKKRPMHGVPHKTMGTDTESKTEPNSIRPVETDASTERDFEPTKSATSDGRISNGLEALDLIYEPSLPKVWNGQKVSEGFRFGALGETGTGKTTLLRTVIIGALQRKHTLFVLAHDTKGVIPEYPESVQLASVADFQARGGFLKNEPRFASFRGNPIADIACPVEDVAALSLAIARKGRIVENGQWVTFPHLVAIDELAEAATEGRKSWEAPSVLKLFEQGRKIGVSVVWTTQSPRKCPPDAMGQSSSVAIFRLTGTDRNHVRDTLLLEGGIVDVISELPNHCFVLYQKAVRWNGQIFRLPKPT